MERKRLVLLVLSIIVCEFAGIAGSLFTYPQIGTWYANINKPPFSPPNWIFGPVWTTLFVLMGISLFLVLDKGWKERKARIALAVFGVQLALNILWSILFFGLKSPGVAFAEIILLWVSIAASIFLFYGISKRAGYILIPYIAWVSFAAFLNYSVWVLN